MFFLFLKSATGAEMDIKKKRFSKMKLYPLQTKSTLLPVLKVYYFDFKFLNFLEYFGNLLWHKDFNISLTEIRYAVTYILNLKKFQTPIEKDRL